MSAPAVANGEIWFQRLGGEGGTWIEAVEPDGSNRRVLFSDAHAGGVDDVGATYDWSPEGSRVAFIDSTGYIGEVPTGSSWDVFVMNADGTDRRQVTDDGGFDAAPSWSPDGTRIVYASDRSDPNRPACEMDFSCNVDIFVVNVDGTGQLQLTSEPGVDWQPDWGPDGRVVFASERDDPAGDVYVMNPDGSGIARLTATPEHDSQPRWSPDGTRIAFVREEGDSFGLYVMGADGTDARRLAGDLSTSHSVEPDIFDDFAWSPDGTMIAFVGGGDRSDRLFVIGADGSGLRQLVEDEAGLSSPAWRPQPTPHRGDVTPVPATNGQIAFVRIDPDSVLARDGAIPERGLFVMNPDGSNPLQLVGNSAHPGFDPAWSPDGLRIAFSASLEGLHGILVMQADGTGITRLTSCVVPECEGESSPAWSPDGSMLAFWSDRDGREGVWAVTSAGTDLTLLLEGFSPLSAPAWSPDGRLIAVAGSLFNADGTVGPPGIFLLDPEAQEVVLTIRPEGLDLPSDLTWSPDGEWLAFAASGEDGGLEGAGIHLVRPDGRDLRLLTAWSCPTRTCTARDPEWSPDGSRIVFTRAGHEPGSDGSNGDLYVVEVQTGALQRLTGGPGLDCCASWQPIRER
ncbi:MAG: PD40 domain-containing protein [Actinobacteria bacterium]|nr:PD40 domain-containing protein [Actinomycetota bacterium]